MEAKANRKRKKHTEEFKREAVRLLENRGERTVADVAASLGVAENLLHAWKRKLGSAAERLRRERGGETPEDELKRLRREVTQLRQERDILKKIGSRLREGPLVSPYELVDSEKAAFPVSALCEAVGVSRSSYYAWCHSTPSERELANERLLAEIRAIHGEHEARYGSPRMLDELRNRGHEVGKHRVARLMRENGIWARIRRRFRHTTDSNHKLPIAPNLLGQRFTATAPNQAWVGDITYIWTAEGWAYLAVLLDLYSRRVVGWALRKSLNRELAVSALQHALTSRKPPIGLVHHTDRGCQYASGDYRALLARHGVTCSMSAAGNCYDNAVAESFFATLKKELVHGCAFETQSEAYDAISHYIENYYNAKRRHSAAGNQSPINFELANSGQLAA